MSQVAIIGAGAWGTALSIVLGRKQRHQVALWAYEKEVRESIASRRSNAAFLPDQRIPECVVVTGSLEVARGDPTAIAIASEGEGLSSTVQREFSDSAFRVYTNDDVVGVELGGALKNIIAIAARSEEHTSELQS